MTQYRVPYHFDTERPSPHRKPLLTVRFFSQVSRRWLVLHNLLADTGADFTTLPRFLGQQLVVDIERGEPQRMIGAQTESQFFLHSLRARLGATEFGVNVAISTGHYVRPVFGRITALDRFAVTFHFGETVLISTT
ncbi:MAG: hypothetical protein ABI874_11650 [Chloroflexota bacterium]